MGGLNWTTDMHPYVAPDVETPRSKSGNSGNMEMAVWLILAFAAGLVILRIYYHIARGRQRLWSEDYFLIAALACLVANAVAIHEWLPYKLEPNVTTTASTHMVLTGSVMGFFNSLALAFSKTSLAIIFMRLTSRWWKCSIGLSIFAINVLYAVQAYSYWVQDCNGPPEPYRVQASIDVCFSFESIRSFRLAVQVLSCALDAYFTFLPWKIVRSLRLERFEKIGLGIAMSFGVLSLVSGLLRLEKLLKLANETYTHQPFYAVGGYFFNYFEPSWSIIASCMPVLRKVFMDMMQWKRKFSFFKRMSDRRKSAGTPVLPLTEFPEGPASECKCTSEHTDSTAATPVKKAVPSPETISLRTSSDTSPVRQPEPCKRSPKDLPRAIKMCL
ncbi:hypothetical protein F4777DRAFT_575932 [Nemania sp. FL0916]|nr:hypothetical protein F4777DRAFT_575932 [Nemania sp. FL0916]